MRRVRADFRRLSCRQRQRRVRSTAVPARHGTTGRYYLGSLIDFKRGPLGRPG